MLALGFALGRLCGNQLGLHLHLAQLLWMMKVHRLRHVRSHLRAAKAYGLLVGHVQLRPAWLDPTRVQLMLVLVLVLMPLLALAALTLTRLGVRFAQARRGDRWTRLQLRLRSLAVPADGSTALLPLLLIVIPICIILALIRLGLVIILLLLLLPIIIIMLLLS